MASFTFTDTEGRVYPELGLTVSPGDVVELAENPDPTRFTEGGTPPAPEPVPDEPPADPAPTPDAAPESETP